MEHTESEWPRLKKIFTANENYFPVRRLLFQARAYFKKHSCVVEKNESLLAAHISDGGASTRIHILLLW
jgi:hypothetical protein